ncbi:MAG: hypothetical protein ACKVP5_13015 [Aestuariivirga sp.]
MSGDDMRNTFAGKRVAGVYPNGIKFEETYAPSGSIDYKDDLTRDTGNWSISGDNFCFFYRSMNGGCFKLHRSGTNCYQAVLTSEAVDSKHGPLSTTGWAVLMWRADLPSTCTPVVSELDGKSTSLQNASSRLSPG